jgi:hypothetical protein
MYIIEKCVVKNVDAKYSTSESHLWVNAWPRNKSYIDSGTINNAIITFKEKTSSVRSAPYRLRMTRSNIVLTAINTNDVNSFKKYTIHAIGFNNKEANSVSEVKESCGAFAPESFGVIVGAANYKSPLVKMLVNKATEKLQSIVTSHKVITRFNSDGQSGGAWLVTSITDGVMSNADVGITFSSHTNNISLIVGNSYLQDECYGNTLCPWTKLLGHDKSYPSIDEAIEVLVKISKQATQEELELLAA